MLKQELIKSAKKSKDQKKYLNLKTSLRTVVTLPVIGTVAGSRLAKKLLVKSLVSDIEKGDYPSLSKRNIKKLVDILKIEKPLKIEHTTLVPHYDPFSHTVRLSPIFKNPPEVIAHELGHASAGTLRRALLFNLPIAKSLQIAAPFIALVEDPDSNLSKYAPTIAAAGTVPVLAEEAIASIKGYKALKQLGKIPPGAVGRLSKAFGTYLLSGLGSILTSAVIKRTKKKIKEKYLKSAINKA
jgi:hypothetical protein